MKRINLGTFAFVALLLLAALLTGHGTSPAAGAMRLGSSDIVVTSTADAGPGTLRDAILAADRLTSRARIVIKVREVTIESPLPALVNPRGMSIEAEPGFGIIDASHVLKGSAIQINSASASLRGITINNAREFGVVMNAAGLEIDGLTVSHSKVGIVVGAATRNSAIRTSVFEHNETAMTAEAGVRDVTIVSSIVRNSTKAGLWFVGGVEGGVAAGTERMHIIDTVFEKNAQGLVLANRPTWVQKCRFLGNSQSAILVLGGAARVEDSEIRDTAGNAISVNGAAGVLLSRNTLSANQSTAIMVRDSQINIDHNVLEGNAFGIVAISTANTGGVVIRDNTVNKSSQDAITVIGGSPRLERNQVIGNHGAGIRTLNLVSASGEVKALPVLDANVLKANGMDTPPAATYQMAGTLSR